MTDATATQQVSPDKGADEGPNWDVIFGCTLSLFAAVLAINDLGAGKYGDDEIQLTSEKSAVYQWYSSKGIKESLVEGQRDLLKTLMAGGAISGAQNDNMQKMSADLEQQIKRYKKEKKEILLGSEAVGKDNWVQDIDGVLGKVTGAKEIESKLVKLGAAGERFDLATLFLQISIVMGAIGIIVKKDRVKTVFLGVMSLLGVAGTVVSVLAFRIALSA